MASIILDTVSTVFICFAIDADNGRYGAHERIERIMSRIGGMRLLGYEPGDPRLKALESAEAQAVLSSAKQVAARGSKRSIV